MGNNAASHQPCRPCAAAPAELRFDGDASAAAYGEDEVLLTSRSSAVASAAEALLGAPGLNIDEISPAAGKEELRWINFMASKMWPYLRKAMMKKVEKIFKDKISDQLAKHPEIKLSEMSLDFDPGSTPPSLDGIRVYESGAANEIQVDCDINWCPTDFHVKCTFIGRARAFPVKAENIGISRLSFRATLSCLLAPLLPYEPVVASGQAFFLDLPSIEIDISGLGKLGPIGGVLSSMISGAVHQVLEETFVLPHRFVKDIFKFLPLEARVHMKSPEPKGVLRVEVLQGKGLRAADKNMLTGKQKSDPFVQVKIGLDRIRTSTQGGTVNPVWKDPPGHLFVYNVDQLVRITVHDDDVLNGDDILGAVRGFNVFLFCKQCADNKNGSWFDVTAPDGSPAGALRIRCSYFDVGDLGQFPMPSLKETPHAPPYLVTVKLLGLDGPDNENLKNAHVTVELVSPKGSSHDKKEEHHANRLMEHLEHAATAAKNKAQAFKTLGFGHPEEGVPSKRKSGKAKQWGSAFTVKTGNVILTPAIIRAMETLVVSEGWDKKDVAAMFGVPPDVVETSVSMRGNFEVVWAEALHFLHPAANPLTGKLKISAKVPLTNQVRGALESGFLGSFEVPLPPDPTWGLPWSSRVRTELLQEVRKKPKQTCVCGSVFANDATFCRGCGSRRPALKDNNEAPKQATGTRSTSKLGLTNLLGRTSEVKGKPGQKTTEDGEPVPEAKHNAIELEIIVQIRKLVPASVKLDHGQTLRNQETLKDATATAGVQIKMVKDESS